MRGINAYVDQTAEHPDLLPIEFRVLGITPQHWTPEVVISRHQGLVGNVSSEIRNAQAVALLGADAVKELNYYYGDPDLTLDPAIDVSLLTGDILNLYRAHRRPLRFQPEDVVAAYRGDQRRTSDWRRRCRARSTCGSRTTRRSGAITGWWRVAAR